MKNQIFYEKIKKNRASMLYEKLTNLYNYQKIIQEAVVFKPGFFDNFIARQIGRRLESFIKLQIDEAEALVQAEGYRFRNEVARSAFRNSLAAEIDIETRIIRRDIDLIANPPAGSPPIQARAAAREISAKKTELENILNRKTNELRDQHMVKQGVPDPSRAPGLPRPRLLRTNQVPPGVVPGTPAAQLITDVDNALIGAMEVAKKVPYSPNELLMFLEKMYKEKQFKLSQLFEKLRVSSTVGYLQRVDEWVEEELESVRLWCQQNKVPQEEIESLVDSVRQEMRTFLRENSILYNPTIDRKKSEKAFKKLLADSKEIAENNKRRIVQAGAESSKGGSFKFTTLKTLFAGTILALVISFIAYFSIQHYREEPLREEMEVRGKCKEGFLNGFNQDTGLESKCKEIRAQDRKNYEEKKPINERLKDFDLSFVFGKNEDKIEGLGFNVGDQVQLKKDDGGVFPGRYVVNNKEITKLNGVDASTPWDKKYQVILTIQTGKGPIKYPASKLKIFSSAEGYMQGEEAKIASSPDAAAARLLATSSENEEEKEYKIMFEKCKTVRNVQMSDGEPIVEKNEEGSYKCACTDGSYSESKGKGGRLVEVCP